MRNASVGLIGVGRIGVMHARTLNALRRHLYEQGVDLSLVLTDLAADRARSMAAELGALFVPSLEHLLESGLDALVIASGTASHPQLIRAGVDAGLPVFCEKPVALSVPESLPVLDHIRATQGRVMIGHQRRFDAGHIEAKRAYQAGELGWIHSLRAVTCWPLPPMCMRHIRVRA